MNLPLKITKKQLNQIQMRIFHLRVSSVDQGQGFCFAIRGSRAHHVSDGAIAVHQKAFRLGCQRLSELQTKVHDQTEWVTRRQLRASVSAREWHRVCFEQLRKTEAAHGMFGKAISTTTAVRIK